MTSPGRRPFGAARLRRCARRALFLCVSLASSLLVGAGERGARADEPPKIDEPSKVDEPPKVEGPEAPSLEALALERRRVARERGTAALALFRAGRYDEAYPLFREADEQLHTLPLVLYMARCQGKRGKLLEARALYERVLAEALTDSPPESTLKARGAASAELAELRLRISTLAIDVRGPPPDEVTLFVDGEVWPIAEPRELDPGEHEVEAIARSGAKTSRSMDVPEGRAISTLLRLGLFASSGPRETATAPPDPDAQSWSKVAAAVAFGVAGAALGTGSVTGFLVLGRGSFLGRECIQRACSPSQRDELHALQALGDVSTASFIIGGVGVAAGAGLLVFGRSPSKATSGVVAAAWPGGVVVGGRFE